MTNRIPPTQTPEQLRNLAGDLGQTIMDVFNPDKGSFVRLSNWASSVRHLLRMGTPTIAQNLVFRANDAIREHTNRRVRETVVEVEASYRKQTERLKVSMKTGDADFDAFRDQCYQLNMHYHYSDDQDVWRAGADAYGRIDALARSKGGMYLTFWDHFISLDSQ